jgi:hypothetical protein
MTIEILAQDAVRATERLAARLVADCETPEEAASIAACCAEAKVAIADMLPEGMTVPSPGGEPPEELPGSEDDGDDEDDDEEYETIEPVTPEPMPEPGTEPRTHPHAPRQLQPASAVAGRPLNR